MERDHILGEWIERTFQAKPRHVVQLLRALSEEDKAALLLRVYGELRGGAQHRGYTVDPYSPYAQADTPPPPPPGTWPPAQAVQQQQRPVQPQQWSTQSSVGKAVMVDLNQQRKVEEVQQLLLSDTNPIKCYACCTWNWRFGSGCSWFGDSKARCSNPATVILRDQQGQALDATHAGMAAKIQQLSQTNSLMSVAPLIPQALQIAQQEGSQGSQGLICVCQEHAEKIAAMPSFSLQQAAGAAALGLGAAGATAAALYTLSGAKKERSEIDQQYETIKQQFLNHLKRTKTERIAALHKSLLADEPISPEDAAWLRENGLTLDTEQAQDPSACPLTGQAAALPEQRLMATLEQQQQQAENRRLEEALQAYQDRVLTNNPQRLDWRQRLTVDQQQALLSSSEITQALKLR